MGLLVCDMCSNNLAHRRMGGLDSCGGSSSIRSFTGGDITLFVSAAEPTRNAGLWFVRFKHCDGIIPSDCGHGRRCISGCPEDNRTYDYTMLFLYRIIPVEESTYHRYTHTCDCYICILPVDGVCRRLDRYVDDISFLYPWHCFFYTGTY